MMKELFVRFSEWLTGYNREELRQMYAVAYWMTRSTPRAYWRVLSMRKAKIRGL